MNDEIDEEKYEILIPEIRITKEQQEKINKMIEKFLEVIPKVFLSYAIMANEMLESLKPLLEKYNESKKLFMDHHNSIPDDYNFPQIQGASIYPLTLPQEEEELEFDDSPFVFSCRSCGAEHEITEDGVRVINRRSNKMGF